jgi:DNA-binding transcriptional ArsR family regulator
MDGTATFTTVAFVVVSRKAVSGSRRTQLIAALSEAARAHSTATVLFHTAMAEQFGLSPTESKTMDLLERFGPLTAGELVERTGLASPSVTALIDRLESKGSFGACATGRIAAV